MNIINIDMMNIINNIIKVLKDFNDKYDINNDNVYKYIDVIIDNDDLDIFNDIDDDIIIKDYLQKYSLFSFK